MTITEKRKQVAQIRAYISDELARLVYEWVQKGSEEIGYITLEDFDVVDSDVNLTSYSVEILITFGKERYSFLHSGYHYARNNTDAIYDAWCFLKKTVELQDIVVTWREYCIRKINNLPNHIIQAIPQADPEAKTKIIYKLQKS